MNKLILTLLGALVSQGVLAATQKVESNAYGVQMEPDQEISLANGVTVRGGGLTQATLANADGTHSTQWCRFNNASKGEEYIGGAGVCTVVAENGDFLWVWVRPTGPGTNDWGVIGGSGQYAGATGGGTSKSTGQSPDGRSFRFESKGKIKTP